MKPIYKVLTIANFLMVSLSSGFGQCSNFDNLYPSATQSTTSNSLTTISTIMYGGDYCVCDVTAGETYTWTTCGDSDFDTQLTLWNTSHSTSYAYNDDDCGSQSTITWTATFTGQVHVLVSEYNCQNNSTSMTLQWACTTCGTGPCASATSMTCGTTYTGTLGTSGSWNNYTDCSFNEPGEEVVYSFTPANTGDYTFSGANVSGDPDYFLMSDCDNTSANINGACWGVGDITVTLTAGVSYYVIIDNYSSSNSADYSLSVDCSAASNIISTCTGTFTDTGGSGGTYSANEDYEVTYCPSSGGNIQMNFTSFDVETNYDWLEIFDGDNTSSPSLGVYDNSVPLSGIVSATGFNASGCLTFVFHSDGSNDYAGWVANISCSNPCQDVLIDVASTTPAINTVGTVDYIDLCQGQTMTLTAQGLYPENWSSYAQSDATSTFLWSFGDGSTATGSTVTHTFTDEGGYDLNLTISDVNGCTNINDLGIRARVSTTPIFNGTNVAPDPVCTGNPVSLNGAVNPVTAEVLVGATVAGTVFLPDGSGVTYTSGLHFDNFTPGQTVTSVNDIAEVCADIEHSYLGDLEAWLECPDGSMMELFDGYNGSGNSQFLGEPVDDDASMTPGTAYTYCWDPTVSGTIDDLVASAPTYTYVNNDGNTVTSHAYIPGGLYEASGAWTDLLGCPLNGTWTIHITDHLGSDNGYIFQWGINFDPSLYPALWDFTPGIVSQSWSGPDVTNSSNPGTAVPMTTGVNSYVFSVTDDFGCTYDTTINIAVNGFEYNTASTDCSCNGVCDGSATVNVTSFVAPVSYAWSNGAGNVNSVSGLCAGTYTVTMNDGFCTSIESFTISQPSAINLVANVVDNPICIGDNTSISANATGGVGGFVYSWDNGLPNGVSHIVSPAASTTYNVTVSDASTCTATSSVIVNVDPMPDATITAQADLCEGDASVALVAVDAGGVWSGAGVSGASFDPTAAGAGDHVVSYSITVGTCSDSDNITIHVDAEPDATITPVGPLCTSDAAVTLVAVDAGGVWSGTGVSGNSFDPSVSGVGSHTVTYTLTNGVCTDTDNITIVVDPMPDATITAQADLCEGDASVALVAVDAGGVWSGAGVSGASFDPTVAGAGDHVVSYSITVGTCSDSDNITIHVDAEPDATITPVGPLCTSDAAVTLVAVDAGGVWSGTGVSGNSFDPSLAGVGSHTVTYILTNGVCTDTDNITIVVDPMPDATITAQADLCEGDASVALVAVDTGGVWSGAGVSGASFDPTVAGAGDHVVSYSITVGTCSDSDNITIHVDAEPDATITPVGPLCTSDAAVTLTAVAAGGVWSGTGVSGNSFDPSLAGVGSHTVTYILTNGVCTDTDNITIVVDPMPDATITAQADLCEGDASVALVPVDAGGVWSGAGVSGASFDPTVAGAGDHVVSYSITVGTCSDSDNITIHVDAEPDATITPVGPLCTSDAAVTLTAVDSGGVWSGTGVSGNSFDPSVSGVGSHTVTYTLTNGVCTDTDNITIVVDPMPDATITAQADLCEGDASVALVAVDAGGVWSGAGVSGASFDPTVAGAGDHVVSYAITVGTCSDSDNITIHVDAEPDATITPVGPLCTSDAAVTLTAVDSGGVWSGTGVSGNSFDPSVSGVGSHTVTYTLTNGVCTDTDNITIVVDPMPDATITAQADLCEGDAAVALVAVDAGGVWSGAGVSGASFDPTVAGAGDHVVSYAITVGTCSDSDNITIHVDAEPDATITPVGPLCSTDASVALVSVDAGGVWSGVGVLGNTFDPSISGIGDFVVNYTISNGACLDTDSIIIHVDDFLDATIIPQVNLCENDAAVLLNAVDVGGVWSGVGVSGSIFDPTVAGPGDHIVSYVVGVGACSDSDTETIHVDAMPDASITPQSDLCIADAAVALNAATAGGIWSGTGVVGNAFDPAVAGAGDHVVSYSITVGTCSDSDNITIHVDAEPDATITSVGPLCSTDASVALVSVDAGGVWSGVGVLGNTFDPSISGIGDFVVNYTISNGACLDTDSIIIHVDDFLDATIIPQVNLCENDAAVLLNAVDVGGVWSGVGVSGSIFDPTVAGPGDHIVSYVVGVGACSDSDTETIHVDAMPDASITPQSDLCIADAAVVLNAATAGGIWSGIGVVGNTFDPAVAGAGDHLVTYVVSNGVCTDTDTETIHVDGMPDASITAQSDLCENEASVTLNAVDAGGVWSGAGVSGANFDPTVAGPGDHIVTYTVSNGVCSDSDTETIHVDAMPDASITPQSDLCIADAAVALNAATAGGIWSGTGVVGNAFDPAVAGAGDHLVTYIVSNGVCTDTDTETIHVDGMPDASITAQSDLCENEASVTLNAVDAGGVWSGAGVSGANFDPTVSGPGDHVVTYTVSNGVCSDSDTETIHVDAMPDATITPQSDLCIADAAVALNAATAGGIWSGTGVVGNAFDPAVAGAGDHLVTYIVSNGVCTDTDTETIHVDGMPDASITAQSDLCENEASVTLNAVDAGGVWSGAGVSGSIFDPTVAGPGDHIVTYTVSNGVCSDSDTETIHVDAMPDASITPQSDLCIADAAVALNAATAGGVWSGIGVVGNTFDPAVAGAGDHLVTYVVSNGVCTDTDTETIHVDGMPDASITAQSDLCENEASVTLNAVDAGGVWSGAGVSGANFDPTVSGPGDHIVTYTVSNGVCTDSDTETIHVDAMPDATITPQSDLCIADAAVALNAATAGGVWSGIGVVGNTFDPAVAGAGDHLVTYVVSNGVCTDTDTETIHVDGMPDASITAQSDLCENEASVTLNAVDAGGVWSGAGVSGANFDPTVAGPGDHIVTYTVSNGVCSDSDTETIHVDAMPDASITPQSDLCIADAAVALNAATAGGIWSGSGVLGGDFVPESAGPGDHAISYMVSNGVCSDVDNAVIHVDALPDTDISGPLELCIDAPGVVLVADEIGGEWSGNGIIDVVTGEFSPDVAGIGIHTISYTISNGVCTDVGTMQIEVHGLPEIVFDDIENPHCFGESNGSVVVLSPGAESPEFNWLGYGSDAQLSDVGAGTYTVVVTDNGCENSGSVTLIDPPVLVVDVLNVIDVSCYSYNDGGAVVSASGGDGDYDYVWNNGCHLPVLSNVGDGLYTVTVEDGNMCVITETIEIFEPETLVLSENITPVICGNSPGACEVIPSGGNGGYTFNWSGYSESGSQLSGLGEGLYTVQVEDALGCSIQSSMYVSTINSLQVQVTEDQGITCYGESNAVLRVSCDGGVEPMTYQWNTMDTETVISDLNSGIYNVVVNDAWGCSGTQTYQVQEPMPISLEFVTENVMCKGADNGIAKVVPGQGTPPYTCLWENQYSGAEISGLSSGYYSVLVSDVNNCQVVDSVFVSEPVTSLVIDLISEDVSCYGQNNGRISASGLGGTPPYSYQWTSEENVSQMPTVENLSEGFYSLVVTDANNCAFDTVVMIQEPSPMIVEYQSVNPSCIGNNDGNIDMLVVGGVEPYSFLWDDYTGNLQFLDGLYEGTYFITVQDANGCEYNLDGITLMDVPEDCIRIPDAFTPNGDNNNDEWIIENIDMFPNSIVQVFNRWGQVVYSAKFGDEPWDGKNLERNFVPTGSYLYVVSLYNGSKPRTGVVTVLY